MDIRNTRAMKTFAAERLENSPQEKKIVLIYSSIVVGLALLSTLIHYILGLQIDQMGGLSQMGTQRLCKHQPARNMWWLWGAEQRRW